MKKHNEKRKIKQEFEPRREEEFETMYVSSFNECTGLIPSMPYDDDEYSSYHEIFDYCPETERKKSK